MTDTDGTYDVGNEHLAIYECSECGSPVGVVFHDLAGARPASGCRKAGCSGGEMVLADVKLDPDRPTTQD